VNPVMVIGAGGHARVLVAALQACRTQIAGFVTNEPEKGSGVMLGIERFGGDRELLARGADDIDLVNGVGSTGRPEARRAVFDRFHKAGFRFASVVHPASTVSADVTLGEGAQIMAGAVLQPGVTVGSNAIINTGALVDHDARIGDHAHVAPGACIAGGVTVGSAAHIGAGAVVIQNLSIGDGALVAAGATVVRDVPAAVSVAGVPARPMRRR
jgi:sugar O-acyltransferase (sialic acid O-acetyltransferase NeuD family)